MPHPGRPVTPTTARRRKRIRRTALQTLLPAYDPSMQLLVQIDTRADLAPFRDAAAKFHPQKCWDQPWIEECLEGRPLADPDLVLQVEAPSKQDLYDEVDMARRGQRNSGRPYPEDGPDFRVIGERETPSYPA